MPDTATAGLDANLNWTGFMADKAFRDWARQTFPPSHVGENWMGGSWESSGPEKWNQVYQAYLQSKGHQPAPVSPVIPAPPPVPSTPGSNIWGYDAKGRPIPAPPPLPGLPNVPNYSPQTVQPQAVTSPLAPTPAPTTAPTIQSTSMGQVTPTNYTQFGSGIPTLPNYGGAGTHDFLTNLTQGYTPTPTGLQTGSTTGGTTPAAVGGVSGLPNLFDYLNQRGRKSATA